MEERKQRLMPSFTSKMNKSGGLIVLFSYSKQVWISFVSCSVTNEDRVFGWWYRIDVGFIAYVSDILDLKDPASLVGFLLGWRFKQFRSLYHCMMTQKDAASDYYAATRIGRMHLIIKNYLRKFFIYFNPLYMIKFIVPTSSWNLQILTYFHSNVGILWHFEAEGIKIPSLKIEERYVILKTH